MSAVLPDELLALFAAQPAAMAEVALDQFVDIVPTTDDALHRYIEAYYGYRIARKAVCPGHVAPFQGVADLFFLRNPGCDQIWVGGRGVGKTLGLSIVEHLMFRFFADTIANIGAVDEQAKKFYSYFERWATLPRFLKDLTRRPLMSKTYAKNGGFLEVMPATMNRLNSPHSRLACLGGDTPVLTASGLRRIDSIQAGDVIYAYNGQHLTERRVVRAIDNGIRETIIVEFSSGQRLRCTPDHRILTVTGWQAAGLIEPDSRIVSDLWSSNVRAQDSILQDSRMGRGSEQSAILPVRKSQEQPGNAMYRMQSGNADGHVAKAHNGRVQDVQYADCQQTVSVLHGLSTALAKLVLSGLRCTQVTRCQEVPSLRRSGQRRSIACNDRNRWVLAKARFRTSGARHIRFAGREGGWAFIGPVGNCRHIAPPMRSIYGRLLSRTNQYGNRGLRWHSRYPRDVKARCRSRKELASNGAIACDSAYNADAYLGARPAGTVSVVRVDSAGRERVYDLTVDGAEHNFVANGVIVHNCIDEVDLAGPREIEEAKSIPISVNGRPPQMVFTSSLKFAYGPMVRLMDEAAERDRKIYTFCVFEIIETCPPERHRAGEGCRTCPLAKECLDERVDPSTGRTELLEGPGKAARADGFMPIADVIKKYQSLDTDTWDSQWRCKRPSAKGLVYPQFGEHHIIDYRGAGDPVVGKYNPTLPVFAGVDFGFANATACVYVQVTPDNRIVAFAEDFAERRISEDTAAKIKSEPWFGQLSWIVGDPAALDARMTLQRHGVSITPANNTKDPSKEGSGIAKIRWALAPSGGIPPFLYIDRSCKNLIREMRAYHQPELREDRNATEAPVKSDDHAVDALRYAVAKIIKRTG